MATTKYESSFTISVSGDASGELYRGLFKVKTLMSHRDHLDRDRLRREYLGPGATQDNVSPRALSTAEAFSQLQVRILEAPSWWTTSNNGLSLADDNVVGEIYEAALKAEADRVAEVQKKAEEAKLGLAASAE